MTASDPVLAAMQAIVGERHVLTGEDVSSRFDGYPQDTPLMARCIVRPASTDEVARVLAHCNAHRIKVIPHGGRTGLCGGAKAEPADVVLSLERMNRIEEIDTLGGTMVVEAGVPLETVQERAAEAGMLYGVDLGARGTATIGGNIATNAGGNSVLRYGMTRDQILGLEVVLADGRVLSSMNRMIKNNAAYDLKHMFIGSEGTLGVVTRAVLRLRPDPGERATALVGLDSFPKVLDLLRLLGRESGGALTSFEVMWPAYFDVVMASGKHRAPLASSPPFYVLAEIVAASSAALLEAAVAKAWEQGLVSDAVIASSEAQASALWAIRDDVEAMMNAHKPLFIYDVSLPQSGMQAYVEKLEAEVARQWPGATTMVFGHIADGNLHLSISTGNAAHHPAVDDLVYGMLRPLGGSVSAEHGIGLEKRHHLDVSRRPEEIAVMRQLKQMLDPNDTLNPGKVLAPLP